MKFIKNLATYLCIWVIIAIIYMLLWYGVTKNWLITIIGFCAFSITLAIFNTIHDIKHKKYFYLVSYQYNYNEYHDGDTTNIICLGNITYESDTNKINYNEYKDIKHKIRQYLNNTNVSDDNIVILNINIFKQK